MMLGASPTQPAATSDAPAGQAQPQHGEQDRLARLEDQVSILTEAVRTLSHGLEKGGLTGINATDVAQAARLADEILIGSGTPA
jgi:hypothetical protein